MNRLNIAHLPGAQPVDYAEHKSTMVNDANYIYLEAGRGETLFLLHGFPDNAYTWEYQIRSLSQKGYRVIAPFLRGCAPTQTLANSYFDRATLVSDVVALIDKLNNNNPVHLVGHDSGASVTYGLLGAFPEKVTQAMILATLHPIEARNTLNTSPGQIFGSLHWFLLQLPKIPEYIIKSGEGNLLRTLWRRSSPNLEDEEHINRIVKNMMHGKNIANALAYFRAATQSAFRNPDLKEIYHKLDAPISTPTRVICGSLNTPIESLSKQTKIFERAEDHQFSLIKNAGHFLQREKPDEITHEMDAWFKGIVMSQ